MTYRWLHVEGVCFVNNPGLLDLIRYSERMAIQDSSEVGGLTTRQAKQILNEVGPNSLPEWHPPSFLRIFFRQFLSPFIYILLFAAVVSMFMHDMTDAMFIGIVLLANGIIGALQEHSAIRATAALKALEQPFATVIRDNETQEINASLLVPGDLVLLSAGARVPADLELLEQFDLRCDESLLTGESRPVCKKARERVMAGSMILRGRGRGIVISTGMRTALGKIAAEISRPSLNDPPLIVRMRRCTSNLVIMMGIVAAILITIGLFRAMPLDTLFMMAVGLAVAAIPEGLPIAVSVALAISMRRMARSHVIVRNMPAVEALGSCTLIATDKTGTLTLNELTVTDLYLPDGTRLECEVGQDISECKIHASGEKSTERVYRLLRAATLPNEGRLLRDVDRWKPSGDTVDVALLTAAHKGGVHQSELAERYPTVSRIPYEADLKYAASFHPGETSIQIFVKGAPEVIMAMCDRMEYKGTIVPIDQNTLHQQLEELTSSGLRVIAFAEGSIAEENDGAYGHHHLINLTFLGMVGMQDPVRPEVPAAVKACYQAGIRIVMITGDDPRTARAIARESGFNLTSKTIATGEDIKVAEAEGETALDELTSKTDIYARVEPSQKLAIVLSLARSGHFVAVTGDGINDGPALRHAHVGIAMGKMGTDVARESADIILTDDNFASIVAGIQEGRVAYANIRKVIFMSISTGIAEVTLFVLAMIVGTPLPLTPAQLLWLNLVTNGIQDVALAFEKAEGNELTWHPRKPEEPIFDRIMVTRTIHTVVTMGAGSFLVFYWLIHNSYEVTQARCLLLLLFVLFENIQTLNSRSEHLSIFAQSCTRNPVLIAGILAALLIHAGAMYQSTLSEILQLNPVSLTEWGMLSLFALVLLVQMEAIKLFAKHTRRGLVNHPS